MEGIPTNVVWNVVSIKTKKTALAGFICSGVDAVVILFHRQDIGFGLYVDIGWNLSRLHFLHCQRGRGVTNKPKARQIPT